MPTIKVEDLPPHLRHLVEDAPRRRRRHKYNAKRVTVDGISFDSKKEAAYYSTLKVRQRAGDLRWFVRQVPFDLPGGVTYRLDFLIVENDGSIMLVDVKGHQTPEYRMKKKQVEQIYGVTITEK